MVTLLNNMRLNQQKSPLGFINPLLYQLRQSNPGAFNGKKGLFILLSLLILISIVSLLLLNLILADISVGGNSCGGFGPPVCCKYGFGAAPGWDAVSGIGSPNFEVLYSVIANLPS